MSESEPIPGTESYWNDLSEQAERDGEQEAARYYGMRAEEYAVARFDLTQHETGHSDLVIPYDHPHSDRSPPSTGPAIGRYPGDRRKVQVKGARLKTKRGDGGRPGRFRLWEPDHEKLVADDALYLFLGYDPNKREPVETVRFIPAADLAAAVDGLTWYDASHRTKDGRPTDLSVKRVFPDL